MNKLFTLASAILALVTLPLAGQIGPWDCLTGGQAFGLDDLESAPTAAAIDGNHAVVASESGRVWVLEKVGNQWNGIFLLVNSTPGGPIHVALRGNRLDVGVPGIVWHWTLDFGANRSPDEPSAMTDTVAGLQSRVETVYENVVALSDDGVWSAIGAPYWSDCNGGPTINGGAVILRKSGMPLQTVCPPQSTPNARFGQSVAFVGNLLLVGEPGTNRVHIIEMGDEEGYRRMREPINTGFSEFGMQVAATTTNLLVGAPGVDQPMTDAGALVLLTGASVNVLRIPSPGFGDSLGKTPIGAVSSGATGANILAGVPARDASRGGLFRWVCGEDGCGAEGEEVLFPFPLNPADECGYAVAVGGESFITTCKSRVNDSDGSRGVVCFGTLPPAPGTALFADGFEAGDTTSWNTTE